MATLDTTHRVLAALEAQGAPAKAIASVRSLLADEDEIDAARYMPQRAAELKRERRAETVGEIVAELARLEGQVATSAKDDDDARRAADRVRVADANGHAVDPHRFTSATTPAEIVLLLRDAETADPDTLRRAWAYAEPRLKAMAAQEQRTHRIGTATSAFNALTVWSSRMKSVGHALRDRGDLADVVARRQREVRQQVLAVARVVGLDLEIEAAAKRAAVTAARAGGEAAAKVVVGKFFEQFGARR